MSFKPKRVGLFDHSQTWRQLFDKRLESCEIDFSKSCFTVHSWRRFEESSRGPSEVGELLFFFFAIFHFVQNQHFGKKQSLSPLEATLVQKNKTKKKESSLWNCQVAVSLQPLTEWFCARRCGGAESAGGGGWGGNGCRTDRITASSHRRCDSSRQRALCGDEKAKSQRPRTTQEAAGTAQEAAPRVRRWLWPHFLSGCCRPAKPHHDDAFWGTSEKKTADLESWASCERAGGLGGFLTMKTGIWTFFRWGGGLVSKVPTLPSGCEHNSWKRWRLCCLVWPRTLPPPLIYQRSTVPMGSERPSTRCPSVSIFSRSVCRFLGCLFHFVRPPFLCFILSLLFKPARNVLWQ